MKKHHFNKPPNLLSASRQPNHVQGRERSLALADLVRAVPRGRGQHSANHLRLFRQGAARFLPPHRQRLAP